jgi:hypothetical protein
MPNGCFTRAVIKVVCCCVTTLRCLNKAEIHSESEKSKRVDFDHAIKAKLGNLVSDEDANMTPPEESVQTIPIFWKLMRSVV